MPRKLETENHVKAIVKEWYDNRMAWHYAPIQNGLGVHGIPDRIGCVPIVITPEMVGKKLGVFVSVEAKKPGRRGEEQRGMTIHQQRHMDDIYDAHGITIVCDGVDDLQRLDELLHSRWMRKG
jgi:predicted GNAT family N-acyltransferase